jgi:hypothetical protein
MITTSPKGVNVFGKLTVESPVTLEALTDTKRASAHEIPRWVDAGIFSKMAPATMSVAKPAAMSRGAENLENRDSPGGP